MNATEIGSNFLYDIIEADIAAGKCKQVKTRFPPEPNGYLHIGSAKAILINYSAAKRYGGTFNLRYDDTNPLKEDEEFVKSIHRDIVWLICEEPDNIFFGSDYFGECYDFAVGLIKKGRAYVCDLGPEELREYRGDFNRIGRNSPYRSRSVHENLDLFERMKNGEFPEKSRTLRAKIDMSHPNIYMRDPAIYRIISAPHYRQGTKWHIYPMYDYAHPIQDALEGITHSMCSIEFDNQRPLYNWVAENIGYHHIPHQYEFAKMFISYTMMGKRYLIKLVEDGVVDGWDDPRMPTLAALRRRGFTPSAIREFVARAGVSRVQNNVDIRMLDFCQRNELNKTALRRIAVLEPLKVVITNYPEEASESFELPNNPEDKSAGMRKVKFKRVIYIEQKDFAENPPPKFHRLMPGCEVRLMGAYIIRCDEVVKDDFGKIVELRCTADLVTKNGRPTDGRKVKGTIHWLAEDETDYASVDLYENLFTIENTVDINDGDNLYDYINPNSKVSFNNCMIEKGVREPGVRYQFVRHGYFMLDNKKTDTFNRIVTLKDGFKV